MTFQMHSFILANHKTLLLVLKATTMIIKMMMTIMINGEDSYKIPMMADDEVLVVV